MSGFLTAMRAVAFTPVAGVDNGIAQAIFLLLGLLMFLFVRAKTASALDARVSSGFGPALVGVLVLVLAVATQAAARTWLTPAAGSARMAPLIFWGTFAVFSLGVAAPAMKHAYKMGYFGALFTWLLSITALLAIAYALQTGWKAFRSGEVDTGKARQHRESIEEILQ